MDIAYSVGRVPIRLTEERWFHITEGHPEIAGYYYNVLECIECPEVVYKGSENECIAVLKVDENKYLAAVYKEINGIDGFVITAFLTKRVRQFERREKIWEKPK